MKLTLALLAALALAAMDYILVAALFPYQPDGTKVFAAAMLAAMLAATVLRRDWIVFATQNLASGLLVIRLLQRPEPADAADFLMLIILVTLGNLLAWFIAQAIPLRGN